MVAKKSEEEKATRKVVVAERKTEFQRANPPPRQDVINVSSSDYSEPDTLSDSDSDTDINYYCGTDAIRQIARIIMGPLRLDH